MSDKTEIEITDREFGRQLHENQKSDDLERVNPHAPEGMEWRRDLKSKLNVLWLLYASKRGSPNWPDRGFSLVPEGFEVWEFSGPPLSGDCRRFRTETRGDEYWMVGHLEPWWYEAPIIKRG